MPLLTKFNFLYSDHYISFICNYFPFKMSKIITKITKFYFLYNLSFNSQTKTGKQTERYNNHTEIYRLQFSIKGMNFLMLLSDTS